MDKTDYYALRLTHTIEHLQHVSRLIYFVSGAVLAMFYFVAQHISDASAKRLLGMCLLLILSGVNAMHAYFLHVQNGWYHKFDEKLAAAIDAERPKRDAFLGSGLVHALIHGLVAVASFIAAGYVWFCEKVF